MEPVFRSLEVTAGVLARLQGARRTYRGLSNIPADGGAVIAVNHTAYTDFLPLGLGVYRGGRRARFMIKSEVMDVGIMRFLVHHTRSVPVDRSAGGDAYAVAVERLRSGDMLVVYPESTISRSFELKEFKHGAVRMAAEAGVPIVPTVVWGAQRQWSKGVQRRIGYHRIPVVTAFGEPMHFTPDDDPVEGTDRLHAVMEELLHQVQADYPDAPAGADWLPARLGGSAPTPEEALVIENAEAEEKARRRAEKGQRR
ncbi:MAG: lysophospholipid acyltransferase family protein [Gordonia sp. (in: high G+C Gram-positive bacteria)]